MTLSGLPAPIEHDASKRDDFVKHSGDGSTLEVGGSAAAVIPEDANRDGQETVKNREKHYVALDGLRGIAILAVFLSHFGGGHLSTNIFVHAWSVICDSGWMGVDLFFALSGFLITGILYDTRDQLHHVKNFYMRRALRIFPLFYGVLFGFLLLTPVLHLHWYPLHIFYFVYLANLLPLFPAVPTPGPMVGLTHFWSLAVEEQFYILWPFIIWQIRSRKTLLRLSLAIMIVALGIRIAMVAYGADPLLIYELLITRMDSLVCGGALALLVRGPLAQSLPVKTVISISGLLLIGIFVYSGNTLHDSPWMSSVGYTLAALLSTGLIYLAWRGGNLVARFAKARVLTYFGRYSYGAYVYHGMLVPILFPLAYKVQGIVHSAVLGGFLYIALSLALTLGLAMLSYHFFEAPFLRLKKRFV